MSYWSGSYGGWAPRKSVAERRADAARAIRNAARQGKAMSPVVLAGKQIAQTFWGKAWCANLERYQDFAYRLDRGRSYLRSGSVIDLQIEPGAIAAKVSGSSLYDVAIKITAVTPAAWRALQRDCAGGVGSRIDLLSGRLSDTVMTRLCADQKGLFPAPSAIQFTCSCPDYATMCKHVAAVMYGVGARLDHGPELLFTLRRVSLDELLASAVSELPPALAPGRALAAEGLASLFGIELAEPSPSAGPRAAKTSATRTLTPAARGARPSAAQPAANASTAKQPPAKRGAKALAVEPLAAPPAANASTAKQPPAKRGAKALAVEPLAAQQPHAKLAAKQSPAKQPPARLVAKQPPARLDAKQQPARLVAKQPPARLVAKQPPARLAAKQPPARLVAKQLPAKLAAKQLPAKQPRAPLTAK